MEAPDSSPNPDSARRPGFVERHDRTLLLPALLEIAFGRLCLLFWTAIARLTFVIYGVRCGHGLRVDGRIHVRCQRRGSIVLGNNVSIYSRFGANLVGLTNRTVLQTTDQGRLSIGDGTGLSGAVLSARTSITIGRHVNIGGNTRIFDHDWHSLQHQDRRDRRRDAAACATRPVVVGDDVLIGTNAIILKGVNIGDRCVIGAGSVVTLRDIPADSIAAGNPARVIRSATAQHDAAT